MSHIANSNSTSGSSSSSGGSRSTFRSMRNNRASSVSPTRYGGYSKDKDTSSISIPRMTRFDLIENNDPIVVVNLARETGADNLLPSALYFCATRSLRQLFASSREGSNPRLSHRDLEACVVGREKLMRAHRQIVWKFLDSGKDSLREHTVAQATSPTSNSPSSYGGSSSSSQCGIETCTRVKMLFMASSAWRHIAYEPDVFEPQDALITESPLATLCESCLGGLRKSIQAGRRDVWNTLPRYFRLEDWEKLVATA